MPQPKYCFEINRDDIAAIDFDEALVKELTLKIESFFKSEKFERRLRRKNAADHVNKEIKKLQAKVEADIEVSKISQLDALSKLRTDFSRLKALMPPLFNNIENTDARAGDKDKKKEKFSSETNRVVNSIHEMRNIESRDPNLSPIERHKRFDKLIHDFEKEYHMNRPEVGNVMDNLKKVLNRKDVLFARAGKVTEIWLFGEKNKFLRLASVYEGDARFFVVVRSEVGRDVEIYVHIGTSIEYVKDRFETYVKRYVYRNLSSSDDPWTNGQINARTPRSSDESGKNERIYRHLRSPADSTFISFTTTTKVIFGSDGRYFYDPKNGQAIVDLAMVPKKDITDTHSLEGMARIVGLNDFIPGLPYEDTKEWEQNAAARDVIRTREIVIEGSVGKEAIVSLRRSNTHAGKWHDLDGTNLKTSALPRNLFPDPVEVDMPGYDTIFDLSDFKDRE